MEDKILKTVLCKSKGEEGYTIADFQEDWKKGDKENIADFIYKRFNERYILPFKNNPRKHGFSMMAVACLMIEALESFWQGLKDSKRYENGKKIWGEDFFEDFFKHCDELRDFKGQGEDFYKHVRCGILHQAETKNGWKIRRDGDLLEKDTKTINATEFLKQLKKYLKRYRKDLETHDLEDNIWVKFKEKMDYVIENCYPNTSA